MEIAVTYSFLHKFVFYSLALLFFITIFVAISKFLSLVQAQGYIYKLLSDVKNNFISPEAAYYELEDYLYSRLWILALCTTLGPLFGLLGTIFGIMISFHTMAQQGTSNISEVSKGIGDALIATAAGIGVSIISLLFYYLLKAKADKIKNRFKKELADIERRRKV